MKKYKNIKVDQEKLTVECWECTKTFSAILKVNPQSIPNDILPKAEVWLRQCPHCGSRNEIRFLFDADNNKID